MKKIILIISCLFVASNVYAQEKKPLPEQASERAKELRLVKEKKFDKKIKKFKGNVVVTEDEILFLGNNMNIRKKKIVPKPKRTRIRISKDGKRIGQQTFFDVGEKGAKRSELLLLDENGDTLWKLNNIFGEIKVSQANGGSIVEFECGEGGCTNKMTIYNEGNLKGKVIIPTSSMQSVGSAISEDGNYFVSIFSNRGIYDLILFSISGEELWAKRFENEIVRKTNISSSGELIVAEVTPKGKRETEMLLFNKEGDLLYKKQLKFEGHIFKFDPSEKYLLTASGRGTIYLFDTSSKELLWEYSVNDRNIRFLNADIKSGFIALSAAVRNPKKKFDYKQPKKIYVFDLEGKMLAKKTIAKHGFKPWNEGPAISIEDEGRKIMINTRFDLLEFENK